VYPISQSPNVYVWLGGTHYYAYTNEDGYYHMLAEYAGEGWHTMHAQKDFFTWYGKTDFYHNGQESEHIDITMQLKQNTNGGGDW